MEDFIMDKMFCTNKKNNLVAFIEKKPAVFITSTLLLGIMILSFSIISINASADKVPLREKMVKSVKIESGDTLWSIANDYMTKEYSDITLYIEEIKRSNGLADDTIHEGHYIIVPYYTNNQVANNSW
jgi:cell division protein YceG involved in septum cleavage